MANEFDFTTWQHVAAYMEGRLVDFAKSTQEGKPPPTVLFRGVTDATYELVPMIGREEARIDKWTHNKEDEKTLLRAFETQARPYISHVPQNKLEWLAIARHYGVPTRLLDWSSSFLTALFFAVANGGRRTEGGKNVLVPAAVYETSDVAFCDPSYTDPFDNLKLAFFTPPHISPQIAAQQSVLAIHPTPSDKNPPYPNLTKKTIDPNACMRFKVILAAQGITHASIIPTLGGLAQDLLWSYKWNLLGKYRST